MLTTNTIRDAIKPTDLRGILEYVPIFRNHVFVIALDGSLIAHDNFQDVLLDIAVLRSLNIKIVLVYGIGHQLETFSKSRQIPITDAFGDGKTDAQTLELAVEVSAIVNSRIIQGITRNGLRCALTNAVRSKEIGISKGEDLLFSGTIDKTDTTFLNHLLNNNTIPIVAPIAFNREGMSLRINSDLLAAELSSQLGASKLIYLTTQDGLQIDGQTLKNLPIEGLEDLLKKDTSTLPKRLKSKALCIVKAIRAGTPRSHILDGRLFGALLNEIFDKVGIGTMVYSNEYQSIRRATKADAYAIYTITQNGVRSETLVNRPQDIIEESIDDFWVYELDGSIIGCVNLHKYSENEIIEIGSVYVQPFYQNKGVGRRLIEYAEAEAKKSGIRRLLALTTQAAPFFTKLCGFKEGNLDDLPVARKADYETNGRNSKILYKDL